MSNPGEKVYSSMLAEVEASEYGRRELAIAHLEMTVQMLLERAMKESGLTAKEIAEKMGVDEVRISNALNGNESINLYQMLRYLYSVGYEVEVRIKPIGFQGEASELEYLNRKPEVRKRKSSTGE